MGPRWGFLRIPESALLLGESSPRARRKRAVPQRKRTARGRVGTAPTQGKIIKVTRMATSNVTNRETTVLDEAWVRIVVSILIASMMMGGEGTGDGTAGSPG